MVGVKLYSLVYEVSLIIIIHSEPYSFRKLTGMLFLRNMVSVWKGLLLVSVLYNFIQLQIELSCRYWRALQVLVWFLLCTVGFFPGSFQSCSQFLRHKMTIISPQVLRKFSIPYDKVCWEPKFTDCLRLWMRVYRKQWILLSVQ